MLYNFSQEKYAAQKTDMLSFTLLYKKYIL